ncbi:MAG: hypothetical protein B0D96_09300 [Candidatus Sedimenticola endophacoides]|uniref:RNA polymerase subunit sigma n=1 Tax=Candidatus Sedimenticola endophacoides TaxID=2548426 RepID=A0A6N4E1X4_9GAMM|nr:MAG: hypothetical protein B0D96_09300 [Candidatus Sedimenticola endophacoides]OQX39684.1 MAG: hypothetical protein B0D89_10170 [Candidatus Sedimenticola endophacoides]PUE01944.1 MAG: RNA polymerase subunit sigma [Candidatus Sedimenticola endophacoides]PUE04997.1 MAG: RNA polymerase subunit sigma [Candidatus Sedimenticola endophacoides]PUE05104.1 MAG: RNA polymerase subunit sigma [Candidatus Sedimenticola endophacoides]
MKPLDDETLMNRYREGDLGAFDQLYERHRAPLFRYIRRQVSEETLAEELYQEVWLRVIRARNQWVAGKGFRPWLYRIAHNRVVDHWRARRPPTEAVEEEKVVALHGNWPETWLTIRDCVERLFALLGGLSEPQRSAFLLKEEGGLSLKQIAEITGVGHETVKSRLRYALGRLRQGLEDCDESAHY